MHHASWPEAAPLRVRASAGAAASSPDAASSLAAASAPASPSAPAVFLASAGAALAALRKIKSEAKVSQRTEIVTVELLVPESQVAWVEAAERDLRAAGRVRDLRIVSVPDGEGAVITTRGGELVPAEG